MKLALIFNFDRGFDSDLDNLKEAVDKVKTEVESENWEMVSEEVRNVKSLLLAFENKWNEREKQFRPINI